MKFDETLSKLDEIWKNSLSLLKVAQIIEENELKLQK